MQDCISVKGARQNNLRSVNVDIPKNCLTAVTGVSGSGKSSLVFDVLFREGQRRYLEMFSSYARQFLTRLVRPAVDEVNGILPAVAIRQRPFSGGMRSTLGTMSELYGLLRLLFARYGTIPATLNPDEVDRNLFSFNSDRGCCPTCRGIGLVDRIDPELLIADDRLTLRQGALKITTPSGYIVYSQVTMDVLDQVCRAHGFNVDIPWKSLDPGQRSIVLEGSKKIRIPYGKHTLESRLRWKGITAKPREEGFYRGIIPVMDEILQTKRNRNILRFACSEICSRCRGFRLNDRALSVSFREMNIGQITEWSVAELSGFFSAVLQESNIDPGLEAIAQSLVSRSRLLRELGLGYLQLSRSAPTLSPGEVQRVKLAAGISAQMSGVLYVVDEPASGLHVRDRQQMVQVLRRLVDLGNTVVMAEHDRGAVAEADWLIDLGPGPGRRGGRVVASGRPGDLLRQTPDRNCSITLEYLNRRHPVFSGRPEELPGPGALKVKGARANNLRRVDADFLLGGLNVITGVSGAGKSSLALGVVEKNVKNLICGDRICDVDSIQNWESIRRVLKVDQSVPGRNPRSNPATYTRAFDLIRKLFASLPEARSREWKSDRFSFNVPGGRCEKCNGAGTVTLGMHFLGTGEAVCPECRGKRFKPDVLEIKLRGKNISQVLDMSVEEAADFFRGEHRLAQIFSTLTELGLGYLILGQNFMTLSGGEAQRLKVGAELARKSREHTLFILDEPAAGLHPADMENLRKALKKLVDQGNTVLAVSHNTELICFAHRVIDLGPLGGEEGGNVVFQGSPADLVKCADSYTGRGLQKIFAGFGSADPGNEKSKNLPDPGKISLFNVKTNNLKNISVSFPRNRLTVVSGVSGSGKSSLVFDTLLSVGQNQFLESFPAYARKLMIRQSHADCGGYSGITPAVSIRSRGEVSSPRSTVATASEVHPLLRLLFSRCSNKTGTECRAADLRASSFSFNHQDGACRACSGLGYILECDPDRLITCPELPLMRGAMAGHRAGRKFGDPEGQYQAVLTAVAEASGFDFAKPWYQLCAEEQRAALWGTGDREFKVTWHFQRRNRSGIHGFTAKWKGLIPLVNEEFFQSNGKKKIQGLRDLMKKTTCPECAGARLKKESLEYKLNGMNLHETGELPLEKALLFFASPELRKAGTDSREYVLDGILTKLRALCSLGLEYLSLNRSMDSLSAGEAQRVRLAGIAAAKLSGLTIVLDEPTRGLHPRDRKRLLKVMQNIRNRGNTLVAVEHSREIIEHADFLIDMGPGAGEGGGKIVARGTVAHVRNSGESKTAAYLNRRMPLMSRSGSRSLIDGLDIQQAYANNLRDLNLKIPLKGITAVTGVSGSGKTSLVFEVIAASLLAGKPKGCVALKGAEKINRAVVVSPRKHRLSGKTCVAVFMGLYQKIAAIFAESEGARKRGLTGKHFSWGSKSGCCPACGGSGIVRVSMDFLADVLVDCDQCAGKRFRPDVLACKVSGLSVADVLQMDAGAAAEFMKGHYAAVAVLQAIEKAGLGYLKLGQRGDTLSGGEFQRLSLVRDLAGIENGSGGGKGNLYLLDEPSAGLHHADTAALLEVLNGLVELGSSVLMVEHRPELIAAADWVIDLGPESGDGGGEIIAQGTPENLRKTEKSHTGAFLP